jgi:hypothetical protein
MQRLRTELACILRAAFNVPVVFAILLVRTATTVIAKLPTAQIEYHTFVLFVDRQTQRAHQ